MTYRPSVRDRLEAGLAERILVLDGAYGTAIQGRDLTDDDYRGERFRDHPHDVKGDPDLLNLTRPDVVEEIHRSYLEAGADIVTTNTFTATAIAQADYGLEEAVLDINRAGAEIARRAVDAFGRGFVAGSVGPTNQTLSLSPHVNDPAYRTVTFDRMAEAYAEQIRGLVEGGVDVLLVETIFDTLNAKAAIAAAADVAPDVPLMISVTITDRSGRTLSGQTVDAFWLSVVHAEPFSVGVNCALGAAEMRPYLDVARPDRADLHDLPPERRAAERVRRLRRAAGHDVEVPARVRARAAWATCSAAVAGPRPSTSARSPPPSTASHLRTVPAPRSVTAFSGLEPFAVTPGHRVRDDRRAPERHGLGEVPPPDRGRRLPGGRRDRRRAGAERREPARREHGRRPARRREGHDHLPEPDRHRARDRARAGHRRLIEVGGDRGRPEVPPGQGHRELDQPEGGRGGLPRQGSADQALRRGGRGHGVRRAWPGRHRRAQGRDPRARVPPADRRGRLRARGHRLRPLHPRDRDRDRGARRLREGVHRLHADPEGALPGREGFGRRLEPLVQLPRQRPRPRGDPLGVPVPRDRGGSRHGDRERGPDRAVRGHPEGSARARRGHPVRPPPRCHRTHGRVRRDRARRGDEEGDRPLLARGHGPGAPRRTRSSTGSTSTSWRTPKKLAPATTGRSR